MTSTAEEAVRITVWRESAGAADDVDAPHEVQLALADEESIASVIERLLDDRYLPAIAGGEATWFAMAGTLALVVVAQQWEAPRYLVDPQRLARGMVNPENKCDVLFKYWEQVDPEMVMDRLEQGEFLPGW